MNSRMLVAEFHRNRDDDDVTKFIKENFTKQECARYRNKDTAETCECGYSKKVHSDDAVKKELFQTMQSSPTDAFGKLEFTNESEIYYPWRIELKNKPYIRLDKGTSTNNIITLFGVWKLTRPDVILSVLSDSDCSTKEMRPTELFKTTKKICRALVETTASIDALLITGGLDRGVDQLIGNEVKQRLLNKDTIPRAVLGINSWGRLEEKTALLNDTSGLNGYASDSNPTGLSLNCHHTHFLLADDGTQNKSGCEYELRKTVELALMQWEITDPFADEPRRVLIYILVGGSINALQVVKSALTQKIPVIVATGTGGAADAIFKDPPDPSGETFSCLPEICENLCQKLKENLIFRKISEKLVRQTIAKIKTETKLDLFSKICALLPLQAERISTENATEFFKDVVATLKKRSSIHDLLVSISEQLNSQQDPLNVSSLSAFSAERVPIKGMRAVLEQMLIVSGIPQREASNAVADLDSDLLVETLVNVNHVFDYLKAIRSAGKQNGFLMKFDVRNQKKETIIVDALKIAKSDKPTEAFMLVAKWENENFFKQLLLSRWMIQDHESVFTKLLRKNNTRYVKLMMEHIRDSDWLTKRDGPLVKDLVDKPFCRKLVKLTEAENHPSCDDENLIISGKLSFLWCIQNVMPDTALHFWKQGQNCLAMALVAYTRFKKKKNTLAGKEGYEEMKGHMKMFSKYAIDLLKMCYLENTGDKFKELVFLKVEHIYMKTPFEIAVKANFKGFFSSAPIQELLEDVWAGGMKNYRKYRHIPIFLSEACPFLAPALLKFPISAEDFDDDIPNTGCVRVYFKRIKAFIQTPLVKFSYGFISFLAYLILFSVVLLTEFDATIKAKEILLIIWTFILLAEEVKQAMLDKSVYVTNKWNYFDIVALILYIIGFIPRVIYHSDHTICPACLYHARIFLAFSLMVFFFRTLQFLSIHVALGPKIFMIQKLVEDLIGFLMILAVFISAYGVASNVIMYPNQALNSTLLRGIFYDSWWSVIQQFNRDEALGAFCTENNISSPMISSDYCSSPSGYNVAYTRCKENRCPANDWIVPILLALYALLTCIMLLNVLIAMFNETFTKINENQKKLSRMQRYRVIDEYRCRSIVPPPLSVITYPYYFCKKLGLLRDRKPSETSSEEIVKKIKELNIWEQNMVEKVLQQNLSYLKTDKSIN